MSSTLQQVRCALALTTAAFLSACKADSTQPVREAPKLVVVAQPTTTDTVQARPTQALVLEVRGVDGKPQPHVVVRFTALPSTDPTRLSDTTASLARITGTTYSALVVDSSDAQGRVAMLVAFGTVAGATGIVMEVPELAVRDTFALNVLPGAPARVQFAVRDTTVFVGAQYSPGAAVTDRLKNSIAGESLTLTVGSPILSVDASGKVTAGAVGRGYVVGQAGSVMDTTRVSVVPPGVKIVWSRNGVLWRSFLDGSDALRLLTIRNGTYAHAAPCGQMVAFHVAITNSSSVVSVVSGQEIRTVAPQGDAAWPRWSADGQWIYFTTVLRDQFGPIGIAISRVHADGSGLQQIGPMFGGATPNGVGISPNGVGISPDGQTVVIQDGTTLALVDVNSGAVRRLPISCSVPQFSPDGGRIACVTDTTVRIVNADGSDERVVATRPVHTEGGVDWSSDGAWLLISGLLAPELVSVVDGSAVTLTTLRDPLPTQASFVP